MVYCQHYVKVCAIIVLTSPRHVCAWYGAVCANRRALRHPAEQTAPGNPIPTAATRIAGMAWHHLID